MPTASYGISTRIWSLTGSNLHPKALWWIQRRTHRPPRDRNRRNAFGGGFARLDSSSSPIDLALIFAPPPKSCRSRTTAPFGYRSSTLEPAPGMGGVVTLAWAITPIVAFLSPVPSSRSFLTSFGDPLRKP